MNAQNVSPQSSFFNDRWFAVIVLCLQLIVPAIETLGCT